LHGGLHDAARKRAPFEGGRPDTGRYRIPNPAVIDNRISFKRSNAK